MHTRSRLIGFFTGLLRVLLVLNIVFGVLFGGLLLLSFLIDPASFPGRFGTLDNRDAAMAGLRAMLVIGLAAVVAAHVVLGALRSVAATVRAGDPFVPANAQAIRRVGHGLLALQLLDLLFGALDLWLASIGLGAGGWTPSLTGWLAALAAFVLAEVWARGAAMRDDLAGTV